MSVTSTELFDDTIDGDIYSSIFDDLEVPFAEEIGVPSFNCLGEVDVKEIRVSHCSFFYSKFGPQSLISRPSYERGKRETVILFGKTWDKGTCLFNYIDDLFKLASMELMMLDDASVIHCGTVAPDMLEDSKRNFFQLRKNCIELCLFVNDFLSRVISYPEYHWALQTMVDKITKKLNSFRKQLGKITHLPEYIYQFCSHSSGNKCEEAGYHVVHCRFDLLWLDLHLSSTLHQATSRSIVMPHLHQHYLPLFRELFDLALVRFSKIDHRDLSKKSPFSCTCVQELWLMLQILADSDSKHIAENGCWSVFESLILSFLKIRSPGHFDTTEGLPFKLDSSSFPRATSYLFSIWFTFNVGKLYTFSEREMSSNYQLVESILKNLLVEDISEQDLRTVLYFVEKICLDLWEPKTEPLLILWEYFQKRLNQLFYIPGQDLDSIVTIGKSALGLLSQVKGKLEDLYLVRNSFEHFLRIVGLHLGRCRGNQNQRHWNLMTGRIYSKLTLPKLLSLNQTGEHHFVSLFLTLALSADLSQVVNKFSDVCTAYFGFKGGLSCEILKGQLALCLLSVERGESMAYLTPPLTKSLAAIEFDKNRELFSITIDAFSDILDHHHSLSLGQHFLIDSWIGKYLSSSSHSDSLKLLDVLLSFVVRVKKHIDVDPSKDMEKLVERVWSQIGNYLMTSSSTNYGILSEIAANLASIYLALSNSSRFSSIVSLFSNNTTSDVRIVQRFIVQLLQNNRMKDAITDLDNLIVETWIRANIVLVEVDQSEMKSLSNIMATLPEIKRLCGPRCSDIFSSDEPLLEFFSIIQSKYISSMVESEKAWLSSKVCCYLKDLDRWLKPIISSCQSNHHVYHIYLTVGTVFSLTSHLLYVKSKPNSLIQSLVSLMLLPVSAHNADVKMHHYILSAVRKTIHLFLQGLNNLGPSSDPYISRCVKELISVYIPRCLSNTGPLLSQHNVTSFSLVSLFNEFDQSLMRLILQNLSLVFFRAKARNPLPNTIHAVRYIKEVLVLHNMSESVLLALSNHSMDHICDIIMYCDNKTSVYIMSKDVLKLFFDNNCLKQNNVISNDVEELLSRLCTSSLAWSSRQLFDLLFLLCTYIPAILRRFLPKLLNHITIIETKRGVSTDKVLRLGYERIQNKLL